MKPDPYLTSPFRQVKPLTFKQELRDDWRYVCRFKRRYLLIELPLSVLAGAITYGILFHFFS